MERDRGALWLLRSPAGAPLRTEACAPERVDAANARLIVEFGRDGNLRRCAGLPGSRKVIGKEDMLVGEDSG